MSYSIGDGMASIALAAGIVGCVYITHRTRQKRMEVIHQERLLAMEKGIPLPEFPMENGKERSDADSMVMAIMGVVFMTLSLGAMIVLYVVLPAHNHSFWVAPLPLAFLGAGLAAFHFLKGEPGR